MVPKNTAEECSRPRESERLMAPSQNEKGRREVCVGGRRGGKIELRQPSACRNMACIFIVSGMQKIF